jgi:hypothetical protein
VLVLASSSPATLVAMAQANAGAPLASTSVSVVGYGETAFQSNDFGTKRRGAAMVSVVDATTFEVAPAPSQPCEGDSGGPAFATVNGADTMVGIVSHGDGQCAAHAFYTRVDTYRAFIDGAIAAFGEGTARVGSRCLFAERCAGGAAMCVTPPDSVDARYCSAPCSLNADCPAPMICASVGRGETQCRYIVPTPGALGSACARDIDCVDGECTIDGICALRCVPGETACPAAFVCSNTSGVNFFCVAEDTPHVAGGSCAAAPARSPTIASIVTALGIALALAIRARRA